MAHLIDVFGPGSNFKQRFVKDYKGLSKLTDSAKTLGLKVVLVMGTYDLTHIGHARYLEQAKEKGAVVVVGVDPDKAVKIRKGPRRPIVPEIERLEMLTHLRHVDLVTLAHDYDSKGICGYKLVQVIRPDIFVISEMNSYSKKQVAEIKKYAKELVVFPPQAETTTSAKIRLMTLDFVEQAKKAIESLSNLI
ncbi:MAG: adenylyltransferase/cytidyltransferase family protein [Patescibacteria group bacterium]